MHFVWDAKKAAANLKKHGVSFEEASTVFLDTLSQTGADPEHSVGEQRWLTFGVSRQAVFSSSHTRMKEKRSESSVPAGAPALNVNFMKKTNSKDALRSSYKRSDFPGGLVRGKYAARAGASSNIVVLDEKVAAAFPNSAAVNDALNALLRVAKRAHS